MFSGEMFIPLYTGKVIDILGSHYQWDNFRSAIFFMALFSLGRLVLQNMCFVLQNYEFSMLWQVTNTVSCFPQFF